MSTARDPGLQAERTGLAWTRTAFLLLVNAGLLLRTGLARGQGLVTALGVAMLAAAVLVYAYGGWRSHHPEVTRNPLGDRALLAMRGMTLLVTLLAAGVMGMALWRLLV